MRRQQESSESEMSQDENQFKITANPHQSRNDGHRKYNQSSQSDISSLSQQEEDVSEKRYNEVLKNNKQTIQRQSQSDSQSESEQSSGIDHIEQRIKRLQNDLEEKIDRQKNNQQMRKEQSHSNQKKDHTKIPPKSYVNPPLPSKKVEQKQMTNESGPIRGLTSSQNKNNINIVQSKGDHSFKQTIKSNKRQENKHQKQSSNNSSKKPVIRKNIDQRAGQIHQIEKIRQNSKSGMGMESNSSNLLKQAHQQISEMQKVIEQLRKQNSSLKDQLAKKDKKQKKQQTQQIEILKNAASQNLKLQKQVQTLGALQSLIKKLKKSIAKKQKSNGLKTSSTAQLAMRKF